MLPNSPSCNLDRLIRLREVSSVDEQVSDNLTQPPGIHGHFAGLGMAPGLRFAVNQGVIHHHLKVQLPMKKP